MCCVGGDEGVEAGVACCRLRGELGVGIEGRVRNLGAYRAVGWWVRGCLTAVLLIAWAWRGGGLKCMTVGIRSVTVSPLLPL